MSETTMNDKPPTPCSTASTAIPSTTMTTMSLVPTSSHSMSVINATVASPHPTYTTSAGPVTVSSVMSQPSMQPVQHHQTLAHPNVAPSPIPQMQVIQQPMHSPTYLPHMYNPQQQLLMPGNIAMSPSIQVIAAGKPCVPNQLHTQMLGKQMLQGQSNYIPSTTNQTLLIGQLGVMPSQGSMIPTHAKQVADSQKVRPYVMSAAGMLQSKSPILPHPQTHTAVTVAGTQVLSSSQFKQLTSQATLVSTPQLITSQSQLINGVQAFSTSLPPGLTWTTHGGLQSHAVIAQNPIFIRSSNQQDMFIQSQPTTPTPIQPQPGMGQVIHQQQHHHQKQKQTLELAPNIQPKVQSTSMGTKTLNILPSTVAPIRPASSVATQTNTMTHGVFHPRPQLKQRTKTHVNRASPGPGGAATVHFQHKADAANQTKIILTSQHPPPIQMKSVQMDGKHPNNTKNQPQNAVPAIPSEVPNSANIISVKPALSMQLAGNGQEAMDTSDLTPVIHIPDNPTTPGKVLPQSHPVVPESPIIEQANNNSNVVNNNNSNGNNMNELRVSAVPKPLGSSSAVPSGTALKMRTVGSGPEISFKEPSSSTIIPVHSNNARPISAVVGQQETPTLPHSGVTLGSESTKENQPQKAIVKPHVLTHVIDGFVIQEAPEPFPVNRSSLVTEFTPPKQSSIVESETPPNEALSVNTDNKREKLDLAIIMSKCEYCGKIDSRSRFKRAKRFCSTSCAKRYNVGCSKRLGLFASESESGKYSKKKKHGMKLKKSLRKIHVGRLPYSADEWVRSQNVEPTGKGDETNSSNSGAESSLSPVTPSNHKDLMDVDIPDATLNKNPQKWSVQDVFEFIKGLPGCADYADEFRLQEIDGQALLLLKEDHLMTAMNMKLGPALKICARINSLKEELQRQ